MNRTHQILKCYIHLAHGEHFETRPITTEMIRGDQYPIAERVWYANERWLKQLCEARGLSEREVYEKGIIPKPSVIANLIYSHKLHKVFGEIDAPGFRNNQFLLPTGHGVLYPVRINGLITELKFYPMSRLLKPMRKAASQR